MSFSITLVIIIVTAMISVQAFARPGIIERLKHHPYSEVRNGEWFRLLTSGFVHSGWVHLLINMFVLFMFGRIIENEFLGLWGVTLGRILYLVMYLLAIIAGDLPTLARYKDNPAYASIGASGAVSAVIFIFILLYPWEILYLYGLLPIPAVIGGIGYLIYSSWASRNRNDRIDHMAHFYGAIFGIVFMIALKPSLIGLFIRSVSEIPF
ncbi:MAG TPA: rhomboid family intramembrane serine protease [Saprospiraceae bacterium]|nr:rhomboid family intramembrane serine protease [Saprospiraceae bacterium]